jgi:excisionase family DNA binding protein
MPLDSKSPLMQIDEAAKFLGLSIESVRKYVQKKRLKVFKIIGRAYLFEQAECERFKPTINPPGNPNFQRQNRKRRKGK